jgi:hypothetical protein
MSGWKRRSNSLGASGSPSGKSATSYRFGNSSTSRSGAAFSSPLARLRGFSKRKRSPHAKTKPRPPTSLARQAQELLYRLDRERAQPRAQHWHGRNTLKLRSDNSSNSVTCEPARVIPVAAPARIAYAVLALTNFFEGNTVADVTPRICERYVEKGGAQSAPRVGSLACCVPCPASRRRAYQAPARSCRPCRSRQAPVLFPSSKVAQVAGNASCPTRASPAVSPASANGN